VYQAVAPFPSHLMRAYEVSRTLSSPHSGDAPFLIRPVAPEQATTQWGV